MLQSQDEAVKLLGKNGELRKRIQAEIPVRIVDRGSKVMIMGDSSCAEMACNLLNEMLTAVRHGHTPSVADITYAIGEVRNKRGSDLGDTLGTVPPILRKDLRIRARTHGQKKYLDAMNTHEVTVVIGPAGTGKTYLAMAAAVSALINKTVNRLILTRPAVEAGESLGFLPGNLEQKVNPYLRPLYDALYSMVDIDKVHHFMEHEKIEVAPLAFMRGRTLAKSFAILDEAQNTTSEQMKMFLTRIGEGSRVVITGDVTQTDLPKGKESGLREAHRVLQGIKGISVVELTVDDVVRHPIVQNIVDAYEAQDRPDDSQSPETSNEGTEE